MSSQPPTIPPGTHFQYPPASSSPHCFACTRDKANHKSIYKLCRCPNPSSHGDAFQPAKTATSLYADDFASEPLTWTELSNRLLNAAHKDIIDQDEADILLPKIISNKSLEGYRAWQEEVKRMESFGGIVGVADDATWLGERNPGGLAVLKREEIEKFADSGFKGRARRFFNFGKK